MLILLRHHRQLQMKKILKLSVVHQAAEAVPDSTMIAGIQV